MSQKYDPDPQGQSYYDTPSTAEPFWPHFPANPPSGSIFARWLTLLTHPNVKTYAEEASDADLLTAIYNALLFAAFIVIFIVVQVFLIGRGQLADLFYLFFLVLLAMLASVIALFIGTTILYLLAKTIGRGKGTYTTQTYIFSMYNTPLAIVSTLFASFGQWGAFIGYAVGIYELFLTYVMLRAIHQSSPPRALLTAISYGVVITLMLILFLYLQISSALQTG